jgi:nucleoside-diphosphate-sugar epimerase
MHLGFHSNQIISEDIADILDSDLNWESFRDKTVLVSGANGFLPAYMVYSLLSVSRVKNLNISVIALVRNKEKGEKRFHDFLLNPNFIIIVQDVCDPITVSEPVHYIIHAASQASPKFYGVDPVGTLKANVTGTLNLLQLASDKKVERFLYFSSSEVYGSLQQDKIPTKESDFGYIDPTNVRACYAESKRMGETISVSWMHQYKVPIVIVRPFHTYGPGMDLNDGRVYADFIANMVNSTDITMKSDGSAIRAFCYISDAVKAFFKVLLNGEAGQAYNVGNDECESSIIDLAEKLVTLEPYKNLKVKRFEEQGSNYMKSLVSRNAPDISKIKNLNWFPDIDIEKGFSRTIKSYK